MLTLTHKFYIIALKMMSRTFFSTSADDRWRGIKTASADFQPGSSGHFLCFQVQSPFHQTFKPRNLTSIRIIFYFYSILRYHLINYLFEGHVKKESILCLRANRLGRAKRKKIGPALRLSGKLNHTKEENL